MLIPCCLKGEKLVCRGLPTSPLTDDERPRLSFVLRLPPARLCQSGSFDILFVGFFFCCFCVSPLGFCVLPNLVPVPCVASARHVWPSGTSFIPPRVSSPRPINLSPYFHFFLLSLFVSTLLCAAHIKRWHQIDSHVNKASVGGPRTSPPGFEDPTSPAQYTPTPSVPRHPKKGLSTPSLCQ